MDTAKEVNPRTIGYHVARAMETAEASAASGSKADFAKRLLIELIEQSEMSHEDRVILLGVLESGMIEGIFELVVDAIKGKLDINKVKRRGKAWCLRLCSRTEPDVDPDNAPADRDDDPTPVEPAESPEAAGPAPGGQDSV